MTLVILGAIAFGGSSVALIGTAQAASSCGQSSAHSAYGGQGQQIAQGPCQTTSGSTLPFTGFDLGLVVATGGVLIAAGVGVRWWVQHGGRQ